MQFKNSLLDEANFDFLQTHYPQLSCQLLFVDATDLEFCQTKEQELNIKRSFEGKDFFYHSALSAKKEAIEWFKSLDLHAATILFVYGIGLGYFYLAAKIWLEKNPHHALVFLEDDLAVIQRLCETTLGIEMLQHPQIHLVFLPESSQQTPSPFQELSWRYFNHAFLFSALPFYQKYKKKEYENLQKQLNHELLEKRIFIDEYRTYGLAFYRNFYANLKNLPSSYLGNALFKQFSQVPAIICGAGPSLSKHFQQLAVLKDKALIFAGSSAIPALLSQHITPHFGVAIDPNQAQYSRVVAAQEYKIPFFYRARLFHEALEAIKGPRLYLTGAPGYHTPQWFENELGIIGEELEEGNNVVNFSLEIARALGCNPIILVGVDLAFTDQHLYAAGVLDYLQMTEEEAKKSMEQKETDLIARQDIEGNPIYTLWKWIVESSWITKFAHNYPELTIINATEGGLGCVDVPNLSLKEVAEKYLTTQPEALQNILTKILPHSLGHIQIETIISLLQKLKASLHECIICFSHLIEEHQKMIQDVLDNKKSSKHLHNAQISLLEEQLQQEIGYRYVIHNFSEIYLSAQYRQVYEVNSTKNKLDEKSKAIKTLELHLQHLIFLKDAAQINRDLIQRTLTHSFGQPTPS